MAFGKHLTPTERFDELIALIRSDDPGDRARAMPYFALIDDARVPPILLDLLDSALTDERAAILTALARRLSRIKNDEVDYTRKLRQLMTDPDAQVRIQVGYVLERLPGTPHTVMIIALCQDADPSVRDNALFALYNQAGIEAIDVLIDHLDDDTEWRSAPDRDSHIVSQAAQWAIQQLGTAALPALHRAVLHPRAGVRAAAHVLIREINVLSSKPE